MMGHKSPKEMTKSEVVDRIADLVGIEDDEYYCGQHFHMNKPALVKILRELEGENQ